MRTFLTSLALVAGLGLMAQDADLDDNGKKTPEEKAQHRTEMMTKELGLSADQVTKVNAINLGFARSMESVRQIKDEPSRKGRTETLRTNRDGQYKQVLTAEQYTRMLEHREKKKAGKGEKGKDKHNE